MIRDHSESSEWSFFYPGGIPLNKPGGGWIGNADSPFPLGMPSVRGTVRF